MAGDSLLLIDEMVIPTKGAHKIAMQLDMTMYSNLASEERTEKRWKELLDAAGFKIEEVYTYQDELKGQYHCGDCSVSSENVSCGRAFYRHASSIAEIINSRK